MKVIIPAAGIGKRLRPQTFSLPKVLLFVGGKPIICHILDEVLTLNVTSIILVIGYKGELIRSYVGKHYPEAPIEYVFQEERKGIGHAIFLTENIANKGEPILINLGDTIIRKGLSAVTSASCNVLGINRVEDPGRFGVCDVKEGKITRLIEKPENPQSNLAIVGLYYLPDSSLLFDCLKRQIKNDIQRLGEYQITDALQMMIESGAEFRPFTINEWFDCGKKDSLLKTNRSLLHEEKQPPTIKGSLILPPVSISPNAIINNSILGPFVSIASNAVVENSIVKDSILDEGATVKNSVLDGSIIGSKAVVEGDFRSLNIGDSCEVIPK